jgi:hypothetical protein
MHTLMTWLLEGDPAIRWQVLRDLMDAPATQWKGERLRTLKEGWGRRFLDEQDDCGLWGGGLYSPKWTSTTYTLLTLADIGLPPSCKPAKRAAKLVLDGLFGLRADNALYKRTNEFDQCISGMAVRLASCFGVGGERVRVMVQSLLENRMPDGGWNCRIKRKPRPSHSSFHTTINVLEGLREAAERGICLQSKPILEAEAEAREMLLRHRLFRSHRTGTVIDPRWTLLSYPPRWHYDVLRALDYFARANADRDPRLEESIQFLVSRRRPDGRWPVQHKHKARVYFDMEKTGEPSRWNTLRAIRVLRWWGRRPTF